MSHHQILVPLTGPTGQLQKVHNNHPLDRKNQNVGIARVNTTKRTVLQPPNQVPPKIQIHQGKATSFNKSLS